MTAENNFLVPDNYQETQYQETQHQGNASNTEGRLALRTSSTNIGLSLLTIISAYDMKFISEIKSTRYARKRN